MALADTTLLTAEQTCDAGSRRRRESVTHNRALLFSVMGDYSLDPEYEAPEVYANREQWTDFCDEFWSMD